MSQSVESKTVDERRHEPRPAPVSRSHWWRVPAVLLILGAVVGGGWYFGFHRTHEKATHATAADPSESESGAGKAVEVERRHAPQGGAGALFEDGRLGAFL